MSCELVNCGLVLSVVRGDTDNGEVYKIKAFRECLERLLFFLFESFLEIFKYGLFFGA